MIHLTKWLMYKLKRKVPVVQKGGYFYPPHYLIRFPSTFLMDCDLSNQHHPSFEQMPSGERKWFHTEFIN